MISAGELQRLTELEEKILPSLNYEAQLLRLLLSIDANRRAQVVRLAVPMPFYSSVRRVTLAADPAAEARIERLLAEKTELARARKLPHSGNTNSDCLYEK